MMIAANIWPVNGDETQYWSWAKHLDWGYYSKPPMVAWLIAISTKLFGNSIVAMRLPSPLTYLITSLVITLCGARLFSKEIGFWSGVTFLLLPGVTFSSTLISTDPPLLMFWSIALYAFIRAIEHSQKNSLKWWAFSGVALGFAFLSKYAALFFPLSLFLYLAVSKPYRSLLKSPGPYLTVLIASLILLPNFIWNYQHAFVSIMAVKDNADLARFALHPMNMVRFITSQFAVFGPILFTLLLILIYQIPKLWSDSRFRLLISFTIPLLAIMTLEGLLSRAHGNWAAPAYIAATIWVAAILVLRSKVHWLVIALLLHLLIIIGLINIKPIVHTLGIKMHQSTTVVNWPSATPKIEAIRKAYPNSNILVANRMLLTEILYFGKVPLNQAFKWNPNHEVHDQYDLVTHLDKEIGKNLILLTYRKDPKEILAHFTAVKSLGKLNLKSLDGRTLPVYVFYCEGFRGYEE